MKTVRGRVVRGDGRGRKLGFPTANLKIPLTAHPPRGVWKVQARGTTLGERVGACNVGVRPTVGGLRLVVEVHVPGFRGDLYGRTLTLSFLSKIRSERRFASLGALKAQIRKDVGSLICLALLLCAVVTQAAPRRYAEPAQGPRMIVDNNKNRRRILGTDWYCVREIVIDGAKVFGGNHCQVKHGEKHAVRLAPGKHQIVFDTISEWGDGDPDLAPIALSLDADVGDKDFLVLLKDAKAPELVSLEADDRDLMRPPTRSTAPVALTAAPSPIPAEAAKDPFKTLERLKVLYDKGVITAEEFKEKKAELLRSIR